MKLIVRTAALLVFTFASFAQNGLYVKYETDIDATGEEGEMMAMMMDGSTMELAVSSERTWVKTNTGTMMTMTMQLDTDAKEMTLLIEGMMGTMAFQGDPDDLSDDEETEEESELDLEMVNETKNILGYKCKKVIATDDAGNQTIYWYTEKFERPKGMNKMPNGIPGLCLEMEMRPQEGIVMTYTAVEVDEKVDMDDYVVEVPEGTEIMELSEMSSMGMGGM